MTNKRQQVATKWQQAKAIPAFGVAVSEAKKITKHFRREALEAQWNFVHPPKSLVSPEPETLGIRLTHLWTNISTQMDATRQKGMQTAEMALRRMREAKSKVEHWRSEAESWRVMAHRARWQGGRRFVQGSNVSGRRLFQALRTGWAEGNGWRRPVQALRKAWDERQSVVRPLQLGWRSTRRWWRKASEASARARGALREAKLALREARGYRWLERKALWGMRRDLLRWRWKGIRGSLMLRGKAAARTGWHALSQAGVAAIGLQAANLVLRNQRVAQLADDLERVDKVTGAVNGARQVIKYAPDAWQVIRRNPEAVAKWTQAASEIGKWGRFLGKVSGVASVGFGAWDAYQGYQKFRSENGTQKWAGAAQGIAGIMTTVGGLALLTGAGAPVAAVAFGVAAVATGISVGLEIAGDPEKQKQIRQTVTRAGEKVKEVGRKAKEKIGQAAQAVGSFFQKAGGWLGSLAGGNG